MLWILALETSPDSWLANLIGGHETIIGSMKAFGLVLVAVLWLRARAPDGTATTPASPSPDVLAGLMHGLYPGLTLLSSLRSLIGSAAPFLFGFVRLPANFVPGGPSRRHLRARFSPSPSGASSPSAGLGHMYVLEQGALRLGASGEPPFLAGFALIAVYAGLIEHAPPSRTTSRPG